ncbi:MAG: hypothetical protein R6V62_10805 [Candidatus Fermentibacteraceae bacterium]
MSGLLLFFCVMVGAAPDASSPEGFLERLALSEADYWVETGLVDHPAPDSIRSFLSGVVSMSVTPGRRVLEETSTGYRVVFPESRWSYRRNGRFHSVTDTTVVEWRDTGFGWISMPVFGGPIAVMDKTTGLCGGLILTFVIIGFAVLVLVNVRRRFRE